MKIYIVTGYNDIMKTYGPVGAGTSMIVAKKIQEDNEYKLTSSIITETELRTDEFLTEEKLKSLIK